MPVIIKCLEKLLLNPLVPDVLVQLVHLQFAYVARRGIEDVMACVLHLLLQHFDSLHHFVRILFVDFSSAFPKASDDPEAAPCQHHLLSVPPLITNYFYTTNYTRLSLSSTYLSPCPALRQVSWSWTTTTPLHSSVSGVRIIIIIIH